MEKNNVNNTKVTQEGVKFNSKSFQVDDDRDPDTATFIELSQELREEGNKFFQQSDNCNALLSYQKAIKLLPENHEDVAILRTNMAACYMRMGVDEYPRAINECNSALQVVPRYSKALLKRARCYIDLSRFDLALIDIDSVLECEPDNVVALDLRNSLVNEIVKLEAEIENEGTVKKKKKIRRRKKKKATADADENGDVPDQTFLEKKDVITNSDTVEQNGDETKMKNAQIKNHKTKTSAKMTKLKKSCMNEGAMNEAKKLQLRRFVKEWAKLEKLDIVKNEMTKMTTISNEGKNTDSRIMMKLIFGEDIRRAVMPRNSNIFILKDIIKNRFRTLKGVIMKYRDHENDLITITTTQDLRMAETYVDPSGCLRLYITAVEYDSEPVYGDEDEVKEISNPEKVEEESSGFKDKLETSSGKENEDHWILKFARVLKNHVGFNSDSSLELHEDGMKLYSEAMDETITSYDKAQSLLENAAGKFQEMAALASFNLGNVYMTKAKKRVTIPENDSRESVLEQAKLAFEYARKQYENARMKYELAVKIKPDFYEGYIALGYQQFEQAKLTWYYALASDIDMEESGTLLNILNLYNKAEDSIEKGVMILEKLQHKKSEAKIGQLRSLSTDEFADSDSILRYQIYVLWGALLYERSVVEYKMGISIWAECLEVAIEKFEHAGASQTDISVMVKNHCSNVNSLEGLEFKIEEIVQAWNEMHDGKKMEFCEPCFRLEPLFRRKGPKLVEVFEHIGCSFIQHY